MTQGKLDGLSHSPNIIKGSMFAIFAFFCMAAFGILTKIATDTGNFIWVSFITYAIATLCTAALILPQGLKQLKSKHYYLLLSRAVIGTIASFLYMVSMHFIPIVNSTLLFNTVPIFIPLLMVLILKVKVPKRIWYAVLIGFLGILVIIKPGRNIITDPGNLIGLTSGLALAIAYLIMKILTATETGLRIIFYYVFIGTLMQAPLLFFADYNISLSTIFYASLCGVVLMCAQLGLVKAYTYASASQVGVYQYSSIVFVAIMEWIFWGNTPDMLDYLGFILVTIAGVYIISTGVKKKNS